MTRPRFKILLPVMLAALTGTAHGQPEALHFQGFVSQGIIYSGDNPFFDEDTGLNFNYSELGLNLSWRANDRLRFAGQVLARRAGDVEDGDPRVDFLLLDYNFYTSESLSAGVRLGRVKNHYGLYNTTRDVPLARPGVFVPQSVYFDSLRTALLSSDGGNLYLSASGGLGNANLELFGGEAHFENESIEYQLFQKDMPGEFDDVDGYGVQLRLEPAAMRHLTGAFTMLEFVTDYQDAPTFTPAEQQAGQITLMNDPSLFPDYLTQLEIDATMTLYSMQYAPGDWIFTSEYLQIDLALNDLEILHQPLPPGLLRQDLDLRAYYGQMEWLASKRLSVYTRYEEVYYNADDKDGEEYAATNGGNPVTQYNKALTLGARWYFTPNMTATAEYSINEGAAFINGQDVDYSALREDWDLFIMQFSYHF